MSKTKALLYYSPEDFSNLLKLKEQHEFNSNYLLYLVRKKALPMDSIKGRSFCPGSNWKGHVPPWGLTVYLYVNKKVAGKCVITYKQEMYDEEYHYTGTSPSSYRPWEDRNGLRRWGTMGYYDTKFSYFRYWIENLEIYDKPKELSELGLETGTTNCRYI